MSYSKIIISGKRCSGKTTLMWDLQKSLNWPMLSVSQYLRDYIHRHNLRTLEDIDDKSAAISLDLDERVAALLTIPDHVVIDTRIYGRIKDPAPGTLKLLLMAPDDVRIKRAAYREGTSEEIQKKRLIKRENEWIEKMKRLYPGLDFFNPAYYDLVIDTAGKTPKDIEITVITVLKAETIPQ